MRLWGPGTLLKKIPTQVFYYGFFELFKSTYFKGSRTPVQGFLFNKFASLMTWRPLKLLERYSSTGIFLWICVIIIKGFCRTLPFLAWCFFSVAVVVVVVVVFHFCRSEEESTSPFNPVSLWKSGGNFILKLRPHMYQLRHSNSWGSGRKGKTEKLVKVR